MRKHRPEAALDYYNLVIGIFLFVSPWLFAYAHGVAADDIWASSAVVVLASIAAIVAFSDWEEWLNFLTGIWVTISPWVLGFAHTRAAHISIGAGLLIAYLSGLELWLLHYAPSQAPEHDDQRSDTRARVH